MVLGYNKKGNVIAECIVIMLILIVFAIISLEAYKLASMVTTDITNDTDIATSAKDEMSDLTSRIPSTFDGAFVLIFGLMWLFTVVAAAMIDTNPIFFIVTIALFIGLLVAGGLLSNIYGEFTSDDTLTNEVPKFPMTNFIFEHLVIAIIMIGGSIAIALFAKR